MEKLTEVYTLKVPEMLKGMVDRLNPELKTKMNHEIRIIMAKIVHESKFRPEDYLGD